MNFFLDIKLKVYGHNFKEVVRHIFNLSTYIYIYTILKGKVWKTSLEYDTLINFNLLHLCHLNSNYNYYFFYTL